MGGKRGYAADPDHKICVDATRRLISLEGRFLPSADLRAEAGVDGVAAIEALGAKVTTVKADTADRVARRSAGGSASHGALDALQHRGMGGPPLGRGA